MEWDTEGGIAEDTDPSNTSNNISAKINKAIVLDPFRMTLGPIIFSNLQHQYLLLEVSFLITFYLS